MLYETKKGLNGIEAALKNMIKEVSKAVTDGCNIIILSDRHVNKTSHQYHCYWLVLMSI